MNCLYSGTSSSKLQVVIITVAAATVALKIVNKIISSESFASQRATERMRNVRAGAGGGGAGRAAPAQGGPDGLSVRARPRHGTVAEGFGGRPAARRRRDRAKTRRQTRTPDRGSHRQTVGASAGREGFRRGVLV